MVSGVDRDRRFRPYAVKGTPQHSKMSDRGPWMRFFALQNLTSKVEPPSLRASRTRGIIRVSGGPCSWKPPVHPGSGAYLPAREGCKPIVTGNCFRLISRGQRYM